MKASDTSTWRDIHEIPALLAAFSEKAPQRLRGCLLKAADRSVHLVGRGSSDNATLFAKYIWEAYAGVRADFVHPHSVFEARRPLDFRGRVVWAFSQSGRSPDVVAALKKLMGWGAQGVAVTNEPDPARNPLARQAGRHILLSSSPELSVAATKTFSLQLWLALWTSRLWCGWPAEAELRETQAALARYLSRPRDFPPAGRFAAAWKRLRRAPVLSLVARGPFYAVAKDAALKFRELAGLHATAHSAASFLHGPVGACGPRDLVLLLSPSGRKLPDDLARVRKALRGRGTPHEVLWPAGGQAPLSALLLDVELKLAALDLAASRGLDPDRPKGLHKVTRTI
ncbi:MAG: SIS domain-containing protein [Elusimicrobia bacterium]|nr:SIS domain-containing protein [Elusimicrobiota bacterium]